ncbi:hypothetical protein LTR85_006805 [Meristemomyces frigidus]|nr:hypothetical protein LTR85_006805 [Meristemomyces frigidus]
MQDQREEPNTPSGLLSLPPELRNIIYRHVLVEPSNIVVPHGTLPPPQPGLLRSGKQVRREAIKIYYTENVFTFRLRNYDASTYHKWAGKSILHQKAPVKWKFHGSPNWANLLQWLHWFNDKECNGPSTREMSADDKDQFAVAQLFAIVQERQRGKLKEPWIQVEVLLEHVHQVMTAFKQRWA